MLDIDSTELASFDERDRLWLERIVKCFDTAPEELVVERVTLGELVERVPCKDNYTFTSEPDSESRDYDDNMWNDLISNIIDHCGGDADRVAKIFVNHFDAEDNYIATYAIEPTPKERDELRNDCEEWRMEEM